MTVFISGGCKNGKSTAAQRIAKKLAGTAPLYYMATMIPRDEEDQARIRRHLKEREGWGFQTLECGTDVLRGLRQADPGGTFLLDSVTALLSNEMFPSAHGMRADLTAPERCERDLLSLAERVRNAVFVSDYLYSDAQRFSGFTEDYRRGLAGIDRALAAGCDVVLELCAGNITVHKGGNPL